MTGDVGFVAMRFIWDPLDRMKLAESMEKELFLDDMQQDRQ